MDKSFWKAGHTPTLIAAFLYFDLSFMVWVILGPLGVQIAGDLQLNAAQKGLMVATPVLAGALLRIVMGILVDHLMPKRAGAIGQVIVISALALAWLFGIDSYEQVLLLGVALGVAGASFAVALPLTSRWYPPEHQGTALGLAGAGNSGTVLAALFAPGLAALFGWNNVLGLAVFPLAELSGSSGSAAVCDSTWFDNNRFNNAKIKAKVFIQSLWTVVFPPLKKGGGLGGIYGQRPRFALTVLLPVAGAA